MSAETAGADRAAAAAAASATTPAMAPEFVQYLLFRVDPGWRRLPAGTRERGREEFAAAVRAAGHPVHAYSTLALKASAELLLWHKSGQPETAQELAASLLGTGLGVHLEIADVLFGLTRPSVYTKRRTAQEQAIDMPDRLRYLVVYPFVKTAEWYLLSREERQGMMNEHMKVGHQYADVRQLLLYATGLDDQEFVVAYETDDLSRHQQLVIDLRATAGRRYTLRDTPIYTAIHRPLDRALALLG